MLHITVEGDELLIDRRFTPAGGIGFAHDELYMVSHHLLKRVPSLREWLTANHVPHRLLLGFLYIDLGDPEQMQIFRSRWL